MGIKGDKASSNLHLSAAYIEEKLSNIGGITTKKMFGGFGIFHEGKMFGMIDSRGNYFLKASEENNQTYIKAGATKHSKMPYYSIPPQILDDYAILQSWAQLSITNSK